MKSMRFISVFLLAMFSIGILAESARACTDPPIDPPPIWITFGEKMPDGTRFVWIVIHNYFTFGADDSQFCGVALNQVGAILEVVSATIVDGAGVAVPGFNLSANANTTFGGLPNGAGFSGAVSQNISPGIPVGIHIVARVSNATKFATLSAALANAGNVIGTDETDANGAPTGLHQAVLPAGSIRPTGSIPTVSEWSLIIMTVLAFTAGTILFSRRRRAAAA